MTVDDVRKNLMKDLKKAFKEDNDDLAIKIVKAISVLDGNEQYPVYVYPHYPLPYVPDPPYPQFPWITYSDTSTGDPLPKNPEIIS